MTTMAEKATKIYGTEIPLKHMGKRRQQLQQEANNNSAIANLEQKIIQKELQASSSSAASSGIAIASGASSGSVLPPSAAINASSSISGAAESGVSSLSGAAVSTSHSPSVCPKMAAMVASNRQSSLTSGSQNTPTRANNPAGEQQPTGAHKHHRSHHQHRTHHHRHHHHTKLSMASGSSPVLTSGTGRIHHHHSRNVRQQQQQQQQQHQHQQRPQATTTMVSSKSPCPSQKPPSQFAQENISPQQVSESAAKVSTAKKAEEAQLAAATGIEVTPNEAKSSSSSETCDKQQAVTNPDKTHKANFETPESTDKRLDQVDKEESVEVSKVNQVIKGTVNLETTSLGDEKSKKIDEPTKEEAQTSGNNNNSSNNNNSDSNTNVDKNDSSNSINSSNSSSESCSSSGEVDDDDEIYDDDAETDKTGSSNKNGNSASDKAKSKNALGLAPLQDSGENVLDSRPTSGAKVSLRERKAGKSIESQLGDDVVDSENDDDDDDEERRGNGKIKEASLSNKQKPTVVSRATSNKADRISSKAVAGATTVVAAATATMPTTSTAQTSTTSQSNLVGKELERIKLAVSLENVSEQQEVLRDPSKRITSDNKQREQDLVAQYEKLNVTACTSSSSIEEENA